MIQTTQNNAIKAYKIVNKLTSQELPLQIAYSLFKLKKALKQHYEFQLDQEHVLLDKLSPEYKDDSFVFKSTEDRNEFVEKMSEVAKMEITVDADIITINTNCSLNLSVEDIETLDGFVAFE